MLPMCFAWLSDTPVLNGVMSLVVSMGALLGILREGV